MTNQSAWTDATSTVKYNVHLGTWINWSRGRVMGATLTLDRVDGNLLIAFTAVFVGIVTERFWRIACILFYRCYSSPEPRDALYHQRQAILRNSASAVSAVWTLSQLLWTWQNLAKRCFIRVLPTLLTSVLCLCAFTVAGGFSSSISSGIGNEVLLNGTNCAVVSPYSTDPNSAQIIQPYLSQVAHSAANYAQQCYSADSPGMFDCAYFAKNHLPCTVDTQAACPFRSNSICRTNTSNIRLDTGYIDLSNDFGVNAPPDNNILFRAVLQCAPLETRGYTKPVEGPRDNFTAYNYGPPNRANYTYMVESLDSQYNKQAGNMFRGTGSTFVLNEMTNTVYNHSSWVEYEDFAPIPALFNPDGDTVLVFLTANGIEFYDVTSDPWYRATVPGDSIIMQSADGELRVYQPEEAASPMGCVQQYQFCNPSLSNNSCGPLASWVDAQVESAPLFGITIADYQNETAPTPSSAIGSRYQWLIHVLSSAQANVQNVIMYLGPNALTSLKYLNDGLMGPLPVNQWQLDVSFWWATYLASLQAAVVNTAHGPTDPGLDPYKMLPINSHARDMCNNQKIRSTNYISFSLFGLYFTSIAGVLIIVISYVLEPIFECLYRRRKYREYTYLEWSASETLQLQRIGFQGTNSGTWSGYTDSIPRTRQGETLSGLALKYPLDLDGNDGNGGLPNKTNSYTTGAVGAVGGDQEAEVASLDDLLDASGSQTDEDSDSR
ncbi:hypothetical protein J7T55_007533 [Diaporthe amygdali]|uniref:uncharacterized protein n=1 Tax=Phomopsis amygdali TaxID=1214568 RepID=UPI0022FDDE89|nr:uncharacterized protein J7T55_007533 [Diaporthe amygdali]KAJ0116553.1 hypothetical protein J7T55_007533 [Diaporthe amygdali]